MTCSSGSSNLLTDLAFLPTLLLSAASAALPPHAFHLDGVSLHLGGFLSLADKRSPLLSLCRALLRDLTSSLIFYCQSRVSETDPGHTQCDVTPGQTSLPLNLFLVPAPHGYPDQQPKGLPTPLPPSPFTANEAQTTRNSTPKHQEKNQLPPNPLTPDP